MRLILVKCPKNNWDYQTYRKRIPELTFFDKNPQENNWPGR
ncbi:hypothetical protein FCR2A7T_19300 [Flavobacterium cauense R2A-7]|nr:hypothetical protein FCR2A7T_19300 [Flavobacterium cauense R2A-7]